MRFALLLAVLLTALVPTHAAPAPDLPAPTEMAYCQPTDVTDRYGTSEIAELTGDVDGVVVGTDQLQTAIDDAATSIQVAVETQLGADATLAASATAYLKHLNVEGSYYLLQQRSVEGIGVRDEDGTRLDLDRWYAEIDALKSGSTRLSVQEDPDAGGDVRTTFQARPRLFGRTQAYQSGGLPDA